MKKITILMILLCIGVTANAQKKLSFGVKGGLNMASIVGDNSNDFSPRYGFHFGVMAEFSLSNKFSIQPELIYSQQGAKQENLFLLGGILTTEEIKARYDYLSLPILAKYYLTKNFSVEFGPQASLLLFAEQEVGGVTGNVKDRVENVDFSAALGVSYKFDNGLNFSVRYNLGLSDINNFGGISDKNQNGVLQFSVGYFLK